MSESSSPAGTCSGASTTIVPGQTATFTGIYTVTAADLAHGSMPDMATAAGTSPSGGTTARPSNPVTVEETDVTVSKSASPAGGVVAGSSTPIVYTLKVANVGTATTTEPVVVTDAPPPGTTLVSGSPACIGGPPACALVLTGSTITWTIPAGVRRGDLVHPHLLGDGERVGHREDDHQHRHLERAELRPVGGHDLPDGYHQYPRVGHTNQPADRPAERPAERPDKLATPVTSVVAFTGALLSQEWAAAVLAAVVGATMLVAARWRRRRPRHAASKR